MPKIIPNYTTIPGQGFTILDLDLGEIALNVNDGTLYLKKETAGVPSVVILAGSGSSVVSSSYALTSSYANYAAVALNATNSLNTLFGIFSLHSYYSQLARTASFAYKADYSEFALTSLTATNASTASLPIRGIITASAAGSTITFTKGDSSTFNVSVTTATSETASYVTSSNVDGPYGKNSILTASYALTASLPLQGLITASAAGSTITFTKGDSSTFNVTVTTATAETASYVSSSNVDGPYGKNSILSASYAVTASYVLNAISASYALSASQAFSSSYALSASQAVSSSYALSASFASTASYSPSSLSASYASTASNVEGGTTNYITLWRTNTALTSSVMHQSGSNITIGGGTVLPSARLEVKGAGSTSATVALNVINASSTELLYLRNDGFVGIGTASAASTENMFVKKQWTVFNQGSDLTNYTIVDVSNTTSVLRLGVETNSGGNILTGTTAYAGIVGTINNFPLQFITNNTVKATLLNTGNFGIGTTSPAYTLDVSGSARITSSVFLPGLTNVSQPHLVSYNSSSGQLYYLATSSFTASWAQNAISSSYPIAITGSTIYSKLGFNNFSSIVDSIFLGNSAGNATTNANYSNFIGKSAGNAATNANSSNFIGSSAGGLATNASQSNFIGNSAGAFSTNANNSNFIGNLAGTEAFDAFQSNFIGQSAGFIATNANNSNFIGTSAGSAASNASYSILIGTNVGKKVSGTGIGSNNIIIGTNITLADGRQDSLNVGGLIFGTGSYSTITGNPFSSSANGRIGINQPLPIYSLDVSGSGNFTNNLTATGSIYLPSLTDTSQPHFVAYNSSSGQLYYLGTGSFTAATASYVTSSNVDGPYGKNSILSASYALSASQAQNAISASYILNAISASYAATASSADNFLVRGTLTAQTIIAQVITSSTDFVTGSTRFGTQLTNTHQFTGSVSITSSLTVIGAGITGSLFGTASWAVSASQALTASYVLNAVSASYALSASNTQTASYVLNAISSSYALSASQAQNATTASYVLNAVSASFASTASFVQNAISASFASTASFVQNAVSASFASTASYVLNAVSASFASTASFVQNAVSASFASTASFAQNAVSASFASTASLAQNALTASFVTASNVWGPFGSNSIISSSFASTASFVQNAVSASYAATASSADNFTVRGTLTAQTIVTQVITSSTDFVTGSSRFGTLLTNTHQFTGSVSITGSLTVVGAGITGSLFGTASWANNAISSSYALSASQAQNAVSASYVLNAVSASFASTASYILNAVSASFASTASLAQNALTASYITASGVFGPFGSNSVISSSFASTASFVQNAISASYALSASNAQTASYVLNAVSASFATTASYALSASQAQNAVTASYVLNAVSASFASTASFVQNAISASFASTASYVLNAISASFASTASFVQNAISASFASTASFVQNAVSASFAATASSADNFTVRNTLTATTIVVQTITSSIDFVTGSSRFGTLLSNTHQFTGSVSMTGSLTVVGAGITGSLFGTSSWAVSASQALTASYVLNAVSSSFASTASFVQNAVSASFANTASYVLNAVSSSFASTASFVQNAVSASFALSSSRAVSASFALTASYITASGVFGPFGSNSVISASHAVTSAFAANSSGVSGGAANYITMWTSATALSSSVMYQLNGNIGIRRTNPDRALDVSGSIRLDKGDLTIASDIAPGENGFGIISATGSLTNTSIDIQGYYGASTIGETAILLNPRGGRVGINTGTPRIYDTLSASLHVDGGVWANNFTSSVTNAVGFFGTASWAVSASNAVTAAFAANSSGVSGGAANYITMWTSATALSSSVIYQSTGNIGIGTITPNTKLDVNGNTIITGSLTVAPSNNVELQVQTTGVKIGNIITDVHTITGSVNISGSVTATNFTGSLFGTASWAVSASQALTASYILNAVSASFASTASYVLNAVSASFALSSSRAVSASFALTASYITASGVFGPFGSNSVISASHAVSASRAITASYASNANLSGGTTDYIPIWTSATTLGVSQIYQTQSAFTNTTGNYDISYYIASSADGSAAIVFRGIDYNVGGNTQINHTSLGISSFVNYGFASYTGSGFYGSGSLDLDSVRLSFLDTDKFEFSSSGMFRAADDIVGFYSFSDRNLKYDIRQVCGSIALDQVQQLQGVYYKWIGNQGSRANREEIGLIAQDVEKVIPQLVREQERLGQGTFKTVDYNHLTALLIEAVKEQQKQIDELKSKLDALTK